MGSKTGITGLIIVAVCGVYLGDVGGAQDKVGDLITKVSGRAGEEMSDVIQKQVDQNTKRTEERQAERERQQRASATATPSPRASAR